MSPLLWAPQDAKQTGVQTGADQALTLFCGII